MSENQMKLKRIRELLQIIECEITACKKTLRGEKVEDNGLVRSSVVG
jgi:hypothetical protein